MDNDKINEIKVLDKGFVRLVDNMGNDSSIVQMARVSYGKGTKTINEDSALIDYLIRNGHTSPVESVVFKFHIKLPLFVAAQLLRHRTASVNVMSYRFSEAQDDFYIPNTLRLQDTVNKQGSAGELDDETTKLFVLGIKDNSYDSYKFYEEFLNSNIAREQARMVLPQNLYTELYWQINLHNLFHFLKLRLDNHAQEEIRVYAKAIFEIIEQYVPIACGSWKRHILNSTHISEDEKSIIQDALAVAFTDFALDEFRLSLLDKINMSGLSKNRKKEIENKLLTLFNLQKSNNLTKK